MRESVSGTIRPFRPSATLFSSDLTVFRQLSLLSPKYYSSFSRSCNDRINSHSCLPIYQVIDTSVHSRSIVLKSSRISQYPIRLPSSGPTIVAQPIDDQWYLDSPTTARQESTRTHVSHTPRLDSPTSYTLYVARH
jgi:hypothetical protein